MDPQLEWYEVALRLVLTVAAGAIVGLNRGEHGRAAGLRTTMLVCLAASVSMIQANLVAGDLGEAGRFIRVARHDAAAARHSHRHGFHRRRGDPQAGRRRARRDDGRDPLVRDGPRPLLRRRPARSGRHLHSSLGMLVLSSLKRWEVHMLQIHRGVLTVVSELDRPTDERPPTRDPRPRLHDRVDGGLPRQEPTSVGRSASELHWRERESAPVRVPIRDWVELPGIVKVQLDPVANR